MNGNEKRTHDIKFRVEESLFLTLSKLANVEDRAMADYVHHVVMLHINGHGSRLEAAHENGNKANRDY